MKRTKKITINSKYSYVKVGKIPKGCRKIMRSDIYNKKKEVVKGKERLYYAKNLYGKTPRYFYVDRKIKKK